MTMFIFNNDKIQTLNVIISKNAWIQYFIKSEYEKDGLILRQKLKKF